MICTFDVRGTFRGLRLSFLALAALVSGLSVLPAAAAPALTMDVATGDVLYAQEATRTWFPASTTKLMTVYVALAAVRDHKIALDTPLVVSERAHAEPPSKMGFPIGTQVTLDNALKMLMVRSANDIAVTIAEGIGGTVEGFADDMNQASAKLGLRESHWVNPNGLPDADHYSSARDMALVGRALYAEFPEQAQLFNLASLSMGRSIIGNHNNLLGRYPGVDGMKTGFTCSAGFNIVASAYRDGRRVVAVVFGAPSVATRSSKVAALFDRSFAGIDRPGGPVQGLPGTDAGPAPDMRAQVCHNKKPLIAQFKAEAQSLDAPLAASTSRIGVSALNPQRMLMLGTSPTAPVEPLAEKINSMPQSMPPPVPVHIGAEPGYTGVVAQARTPHSAVGSEPQPVAAIAYSATAPEPSVEGAAGNPLSVDANALPLRGRKAHAGSARHGRAAMKTAAHAPKSKVIGGEAKTKPAAKTAKAPAAKAPATKAPAKATAKKQGTKIKSAAGH